MNLRNIIARPLLVALVALALSSQASADPGARQVKAQIKLIELGGYVGAINPSTGHALKASGVAHREFDAVAFTVGGRASYMRWFALGAELEGGISPTSTERDGFAMLYHVRAHALLQYPVWRRLCLFLVAGGGIWGVASNPDVLGRSVDPAFHWGWGGKYYLRDNLALRADFRHTVSEGIGLDEANHFELTVGAAWVFGWRKDSDGDGVRDALDKCPHASAQTGSGCPNADADGDGVPDYRDQCPHQKSSSPQGCPPKEEDRDGDNIPDARDKCPKKSETFNEFQDEDGCPDRAPTPIRMFNAAIQGKVNFSSGLAGVDASSELMLDRLAEVLKAHPKLVLLVRCHTDSIGDHDANVRLSLRRAQAVKKYLESAGVPSSHITVEGVGNAEPLADNETDRGRALNRRIEFRVTLRK